MRAARLLLIVCVVAGCSKKTAPSEAQGSGSAPATATPVAPARLTAFWTWFSAHAAELRADKDMRHTMEAISAEIEKEQPGVFAEIGGDGADRTLVLSAGGDKKLFPAVEALYAGRPASVPGWKIVAFRQRDQMGTIELGGKKLDPATMKFVAAKENGKLSIIVFVPGFTTNEEFGEGLFIVLDHAVGEHDMESKIGGIDFQALDKASPDARPLAELPALIDKTFPP